MTDIHTHILPYIDDGTVDEAETAELLKLEQLCGVQRIVFTPHFDLDNQNLDSFVNSRNKVSQQAAILKINIKTKLGAEVLFSPNLCGLDITPLCIEDTKYIIIELNFNHCPYNIEETLYKIQLKGFTPIIAHAERYSYVRKDPSLLCTWTSKGWIVQVNSTSLFNGYKLRRMIINWIRQGFVHVIASDTHFRQKRKPCLDKALLLIKRKCGAKITDTLIENSDKIFYGIAIN